MDFNERLQEIIRNNNISRTERIKLLKKLKSDMLKLRYQKTGVENHLEGNSDKHYDNHLCGPKSIERNEEYDGIDVDCDYEN